MKNTFFVSGTARSDTPAWAQFSEIVSYLVAKKFVLTEKLPADILISMNYSSSDYASYIRSGGDPRYAVLVLLEPNAVYPMQYSKKVFQKYGLILKPGNTTNFHSIGDFLGWPYEVNANPLNPSQDLIPLNEVIAKNIQSGFFEFEHWKNREQFLTMINSNKVSGAGIENYTLRRRFAREIDPLFISVYGELWNSSYSSKIIHRLQTIFQFLKHRKVPNIRNIYGNLHWVYPSAHGAISDKHKLLQNVQFNLVIENDPNYVSEKLFDSMINGCIPLYLGPSIPNSLVPKECFLEISAEPTGLMTQLGSISSAQINEMLQSIQLFLSSPDFYSIWEKSHVFSNLGEKISEYLGAQNG